jgi:hypothetical protein
LSLYYAPKFLRQTLIFAFRKEEIYAILKLRKADVTKKMYQFYLVKARVATQEREKTNENKLRRIIYCSDVS